MKTKYLARLLASVLLTLAGAGITFSQEPAQQSFVQRLAAAKTPKLTRFDLDFPGGTPRDLINAIEKASGRTLNVIMPDDEISDKLPALKLKNVTVVDLFGALGDIGEYTVKVPTGEYENGKPMYRKRRISYRFTSRGGGPDDNSIWTLVPIVRSMSPPTSEEPKDIRYYNLAPYLDTFKIDDITTAVRTGWEMLGESTGAKFSYHKDTKLLIAVGRPDQLAVIEAVLKELAPTAQKQGAIQSVLDARRVRLDVLKDHLADLKQQFSPEHPNVIAMQQQIEDLERQIKALSAMSQSQK